MRAASVLCLVGAISAAGCSSTSIDVVQASATGLPADAAVGRLRVIMAYETFRSPDLINAYQVETREPEWIARIRRGFAVQAVRDRIVGRPDTGLPVRVEVMDVNCDSGPASRCPFRLRRPEGTRPAVVRARVLVGDSCEFVIDGLWNSTREGSGFHEFAEDFGAEIAKEIARLRG
jgi:hypothetical protein